MCEEAASLTLSTQDVALALKDLDVILSLMTKQAGNADSELHAQLPEDLALEDVALLKEFVMNLEVALTKAVADKDLEVGKSYKGDHLTKVLS